MKLRFAVDFRQGKWQCSVIGAVVIGIPIMAAIFLGKTTPFGTNVLLGAGLLVWGTIIATGIHFDKIQIESDPAPNPKPYLTGPQWGRERDSELYQKSHIR